MSSIVQPFPVAFLRDKPAKKRSILKKPFLPVSKPAGLKASPITSKSGKLKWELRDQTAGLLR